MDIAGARDPRVTELRDALPGQVLLGTGGVRYHLRERIGEGGQGWVYRATWDDPEGFFVTVKVLRPDAVSADTLNRFQREAEVLRTLSKQARPNPHIVRFYDHATARLASPRGGEPLAIPFTVLEYVHGTNLEQVLAQTRGQGAPLERVRRIIHHVVLALEDVHRHDVVHRDLKPSNILLACDQGDEIAKVTDFGLVKLVEMNLQHTTTLAGASLGYAPPEQYEQGNQRVSPRTDVFSLAAILFEMLAGAKAFPYREAEHPLIVVTRLLMNPRPQLASTTAALSPELRGRADLIAALDAEISRALSVDPDKRHASASAFWAAIEPLFRKGSSTFRSAAPAAAENPPLRASVPPIAAHERTLVSQAALKLEPALAKSFTPVPVSNRESTPTPRAPSDPRASSPGAWSWRIATPPRGPGVVRAAYFGGNGDSILAAGPTGILRWEHATWSELPVPAALDPHAIRGALALADMALLVFGERSLAGRLRADGGFEPWRLPDPTITFHGGHVDASTGLVTLVGERPSRFATARPQLGGVVGCVAQFSDGGLVLMSDVPTVARLRAVTQLDTGAWLACGDWGALVRLASGVAEHVGAVCGGHLNAIASLPGGAAVTVGAGGHALSLSRRLEAQLEAVQTTRDLGCLALADDHAPWAGAAQARVLRRAAGNTATWVRMSGDVGLASTIVALHATTRIVRAVCDDGALIEGTLH